MVFVALRIFAVFAPLRESLELTQRRKVAKNRKGWGGAQHNATAPSHPGRVPRFRIWDWGRSFHKSRETCARRHGERERPERYVFAERSMPRSRTAPPTYKLGRIYRQVRSFDSRQSLSPHPRLSMLAQDDAVPQRGNYEKTSEIAEFYRSLSATPSFRNLLPPAPSSKTNHLEEGEKLHVGYSQVQSP